MLIASYFTDKAALRIARQWLSRLPYREKAGFVWVFIIPYSGKLAPSLASGHKT